MGCEGVLGVMGRHGCYGGALEVWGDMWGAGIHWIWVALGRTWGCSGGYVGYGGTLWDMEPIGGWVRSWGCAQGIWEAWRELGVCWEIWGDTGRGMWGGVTRVHGGYGVMGRYRR